MVYYGALSKGCQRCRQRKIKCDQRKPSCLRCEKAKTQCPGFRNLTDVTFRDESKRIIENSHAAYNGARIERPASIEMLDAVHVAAMTPMPAPSLPLTTLPPRPYRRVNETAAHFFFSMYTCDEPPLFKDCHAWLTQIYCEHPHHHALRAAVEAAEMAGISSIFYAPEVEARSREEYGRALAATIQALNDTAASILDTTFLAVILLGLFEFIHFDNTHHHRPSIAHIEGAISLLQLRGRKQFDDERGPPLFQQLRSQMLYSFMQHNLAVPLVLLQLNRSYKPSFLGDMSFRSLNLRAAINRGTGDREILCETARQMDRELDAWKEALPPISHYKTVGNHPRITHFKGTRHLYRDIWTAQLWNSWRTISIQVNQMILESETCIGMSNAANGLTEACKIRESSTNICISVPEVLGSPHSAALIWSLLVVSREPLNDYSERAWAIEQLRQIGSSRVIRQANLFAKNPTVGVQQHQTME